MKYIVTVALRYIQRQKTRTFMTFLSIAVASFIIGMVCLFANTAIDSGKNYIIDTEGSWEVDVSDVFFDEENPSELLKRMSEHVVTDEIFCIDCAQIYSSRMTMLEENSVIFFEIDFGEKQNFYTDFLINYRNYGNSDIIKSEVIGGDVQKDLIGSLKKDVIMIPESLRQYGYDIGDEIELTITPMYCKVDMESDYVSEKFPNIGGFDLPKIVKNAISNNIENSVLSEYNVGTPVSVGYEVGGFYSESDINANDRNFDVFVLLTSNGSHDILEDVMFNSEELADCEVTYSRDIETYITVNDNVNIQEGVETLLINCGYPKERTNDMVFHTELLALEGKLAYSVVVYAPLIFFCLFFVVLIWLLVRMVIDNAFEISAQERTAQFALLRIVGASKKQMKAFVFCEALFYIIFAIPAGMIMAFSISKCVIYFIKKSGVDFIECSVHPVIILIGIFICIVSVLISSYTSAFWKSRKKSLVESQTAHYKFKKNSSKNVKCKKKRKIKNIKSPAFILRYTRKNISRTRGRFIISVAAMSIGVTAFSLLMSVVFSAKELYAKDNYEMMDFSMWFHYIDREEAENMVEIYEKFNQNKFVEKIYLNSSFNIKTDSDMVKVDSPKYSKNNYKSINLNIVNEEEYRKSYQQKTKVTYEQLANSDEAIMVIGESISLNFKENKTPSINNIKIADIIDYKYYSEYLEMILTYDTYKKMTSVFEEQSNSSMRSLSLGVKVHSDVDHYDAVTEIKKLAEESGHIYEFEDMYFGCTGLKSFMSGISILICMFIGAMWLSGIITMSNSINTSVLNRKEEFISMRAVGMTKKKLFALVHVESGIFVLTSSVIGIFISSAFYITALNDFPVKCMLISAIIVFVLNIVFGAIATIPAVRTVRDKVKVNSIE
ncbi:MAG: ABC transporter permease [Ruminococcus sp.]|nr:ABC transporter permease [Ruminococcus sp.]